MILVTGANGFLGSAIMRELWRAAQPVGAGYECPNARALIHRNGPGPGLSGVRAQFVHGDVGDLPQLHRAFEGTDTVIHAAGLLSMRRSIHPETYQTNVVGTANVVTACRLAGVRRLVYVSSVHAAATQAHGVVQREGSRFEPDLVEGDYAKTKAEATAMVLGTHDLEVVVVQPSGIVGPRDHTGGNMTQVIRDALSGRLPATVRGGYDFVDVRDVAAGCLAAAECGRSHESYLLSGSYHRISDIVTDALRVAGRPWRRPEIPMWLAGAAAPVMEMMSNLREVPPTFSPMSLRILASNGVFDHGKATREFGYCPRPWAETITDWVNWILASHPERFRSR